MRETNSYNTSIFNALTNFEGALGHRENWKSACTLLSTVFQDMGKRDDARFWLHQGEEDELDLVRVYSQLGKHYTDLSHWEQAISAFQNLLTLGSDPANTYQILAQLFERAGRQEEYLVSWYHYLRLRPNDATPKEHYHLARELEKQGQTVKAMDCYQRSLRQDPVCWEAYFDLADLFLAQGQVDEAICTYQTLLERDPNRVEAHYKLGKAWMQNQNYKQAVVQFNQTIELAPKFPGAYEDIVKTLMQQGLWDEAIVISSAVIKLVQPFPWAYTYKGNALHKKGENLKAIACHQKACEMRGWELCSQRGYLFTQDRFSQQTGLLRKYLEHITNSRKVNILVIGCSQGMVPCWLLDCVLKGSSDRLTCIDSQFSQLFLGNLDKNESSHKVCLKEGHPADILRSIDTSTYDMVIIQQLYKQLDNLGQISRLAWKSLKVNGMMLFRGYLWRNPSQPTKTPKAEIDRFLETIKQEVEIVHQSFFLLVQKTPSSYMALPKALDIDPGDRKQLANQVQTLILIAIGRTGSNYLCNLLGRHPQIEARYEIFANVEATSLTDGEIEALSDMANYTFKSSEDLELIKYLKTNYHQLIQVIKSRLTKEKLIFSFKIFQDHLLPQAMTELIDDSEVIFVTRTVIDTYISKMKALQLETWVQKDTTEFKPAIDANHFVHWYNENCRYYQSCAKKYRDTHHKEIEVLRYEHFTQGNDLENFYLVSDKISTLTGIQFTSPNVNFKSIFCKQDRNESIDKKVANWPEFEKQLKDKGYLDKALGNFL